MSTIKAVYPLSENVSLEIAQGDLTHEMVDAIVNAANDLLQHGGGIAGAISRAGGPRIQLESNAWVAMHGPVQHDRPAYTSAGNLPCRYVIHAVGPVWGTGDEDRRLGEAVTGSLELAEELQLRSIAFPAISTGIYRFPVDRAARVFMGAIKSYFDDHAQTSLQLVRIVLYDSNMLYFFLSESEHWFKP